MTRASSSTWRRYHRVTRSATYSVWSALPLFVLYEWMIVMVNPAGAASVRVGAEVWIKELFAVTGAQGGLTLLLIAMGAIIFAYVQDRHRSVPLHGRYFVGILAEGGVYAIVVALLVSRAVGLLFAVAPLPTGSVWTQFALSIGAGLYEELLFRVLLVGGLALAFKLILEDGRAAYVVAALFGALLFSLAHYLGPLGDPFALSTFAFRFLFGLALNAIFLARGFGVAAWTHALYDILVVLGALG